MAFCKKCDKSSHLLAHRYHYRAAQTLDPSVQHCYELATHLHRRGKDLAHAERMYERAVALDAKHARAHLYHGRLRETVHQDYDGAATLYRSAIAADATLVKAVRPHARGARSIIAGLRRTVLLLAALQICAGRPSL